MNVTAEHLVETANRTAKAAQDGLDWLDIPKNAQLVGDDLHGKRRILNLGIKTARRLAGAAQRPMAVAVFGPSQAGKSHLINTLSRRDGKLLASFKGMEPVNYISRINPEKQDRESTGLVTRFSVRGTDTPAGFPVHLRLLEHADIIKIIANAYFFDGEPEKYEEWPDREKIRAHIDRFRTVPAAPTRTGLDAASVWDIEDYISDREYMGHFELIKQLKASDFWTVAARAASSLPVRQLADLFSILWGGHAALSRLYVQFVEALQQLDFPSDAYVPFSAIDLEDMSAVSILDVDALRGLGGDDPSTVEVCTAAGVRATLPRSVVMAITAELHIHMKEQPWPFFDHTDLLDFPGYRVRGVPTSTTGADNDQGSLAHKLAQAPVDTIAALMLRGKVEYLFQRYVAEQEITAMLLCVREGNFETKSLPPAIGKWIGTTHGVSAQDRAGKDTLLFFVLTRFDMHFTDAVPDRLAQLITGRIEESLLKPFGATADGWIKQWVPGSPFRNVYLMRKPAPERGGLPLFAVEAGKETDLLPNAPAMIEQFRKGFLASPPVHDYFAEPERAINELFRIDDGGSSYLAEKLGPVCRPEIKPGQVNANLRRLQDHLHRQLESAYRSSNVDERLQKRLEVAGRIIEDLHDSISDGRIGSLIRGMMMDAGAMSDCLYRGEDADEDDTAFVTPMPESRTRAISLPGVSPRAALQSRSNASRNIYHRMASIAMKGWFTLLHARASDDAFAAEVRMRRENLEEIVAEIIQAAGRVRLVDAIAQTVESYAYGDDGRDLRREKAAIVSVRLINRFVADFGLADRPEDERPIVPDPSGGPGRPVFQQRAVVYDASGIQRDPAPYQMLMAEDWMYGLYHTVQLNATSEDGVEIDLIQNGKLGTILQDLIMRPGVK